MANKFQKSNKNIDLGYRSWDTTSPSYRIIEIEHSRIHSGDGFQGSIPCFELGPLQTYNILGITNDFPIHLKQRDVTLSEGLIKAEVFEDVVIDTPGDSVLIEILNRTNIKDPGFSIQKDAEFSGGNLISEWHVRATFGGPPPARPPVTDIRELEWIYKANTNYGLRITNLDDEVTIDCVFIYWFWYVQRPFESTVL